MNCQVYTDHILWTACWQRPRSIHNT